jgi:hypothetical protein
MADARVSLALSEGTRGIRSLQEARGRSDFDDLHMFGARKGEMYEQRVLLH